MTELTFDLGEAGLEEKDDDEMDTLGSAPASNVVEFDFDVNAIDTASQKEKARTAVAAPPDQHRANKAVAATVGVDVGVVERDDGALKNEARVKEIEAATANSPSTREWLGKDDNINLAHDDVENLAFIEDAWDSIANVAKGIGESAFDVVGYLTETTGILAKGGANLIDEYVPGQIEYDFSGEGPMFSLRHMNAAERGEKSVLDDFGQDFKKVDFGYKKGTTWEEVKESPLSQFIPFAIETGLVSLPDMAAAILNLPAFVLKQTGAIGEDRAKNDGRPGDTTTGDLFKALPAAVFSAVLEKWAGRGILGLTDDLVGTGAKAIAKAGAKGVVLESVTEGAQEGIETLGGSVGTQRGVEWGEVGESILQGIVAGGPFGGSIRVGTATIQSNQRVKYAKTRTKAINDINNKESKLRDLSPESYAAAQGEYMRKSGVESIEIDAEGMKVLNQDYSDFELGEDADASVTSAAGTSTTVTPEQYWSLPKEAISKIAANTSFNAGQMTEKESSEVDDLVKEFGGTLTEEEIAAEQAGIDPENQIYTEVYNQLLSAGATSVDAGPKAAQMAAVFNIFGQRAGIDPLKVAERFLPSIRKQLPEFYKTTQPDGQDYLIERVKRAASQPTEQQALGQTLLEFIAQRGGIIDKDGEFDVNDMATWQKANPFIGKLLQDMPADLGADMLGGGAAPDLSLMPDYVREAAIEAGFLEEGADINDLLMAVGEELQGRPSYSIANQDADALATAQSIADLLEFMDRNDIDVGLDSQEIKKQIAAVDADISGRTLDQPGSPAFDAWAGDGYETVESEEINYTDFSEDKPYVLKVFHGTTHNIDLFLASVRGNKEGQFGAVNYFTSSEGDANENYAGQGPDLTGRIEGRSVEIESDNLSEHFNGTAEDLLLLVPDMADVATAQSMIDSDIMPEALAARIAYKEMTGGKEQVLEMFVRTEKPFVVGADVSPWIEFVDFDALESEAIERVAEDNDVSVLAVKEDRENYEEQIDETRWEIEADTPNALTEAIEEVAAETGIDAKQLLFDLMDISVEGLSQSNLEKTLRDSEALAYAEDQDSGRIIGSHVIGQIIQKLGFDSIILKNAEERFTNMNMEPGTAHVHVFDENNRNIKSVNNRGTYDPNDPRIMYQPGSPAFDAWFGDSKVVDADGNPLVVYRGEFGGDTDTFNTNLTTPSFSESKYVAGDYAADGDNARVSQVYLSIKNPIQLGDMVEDVVTYSELKEKLAPQNPEEKILFEEMIKYAANWRGYEGSPMDGGGVDPTVSNLDGVLNNPGAGRDNPYTDTFTVADSPAFVKLAKARGYDGAIYNGVFTATDKAGVIPADVLDDLEGDGAIEYRPFHPTQIKSVNNRGTYDPNDARIMYQQIEKLGINEDVSTEGTAYQPKKTRKAYKLFAIHPNDPGKLFPLYVGADTPMVMGEWMDAAIGDPGKTTKTGKAKVKSKIGDLAFRPGWHAGTLPFAHQIGGKDADGNQAIREPFQVWAEVEVADDVDWQTEANSRASTVKSGPNKGNLNKKEAQIDDQIPVGGNYEYNTSSNVKGTWVISGSVKVNRVLSDAEVETINTEAGVQDYGRVEPRMDESQAMTFFQDGDPIITPEELVAKSKAALKKLKTPEGGMGGTSITRLYNEDYPKQRGEDGRLEVRKGHRKSKLEISQEIHEERVEGRDTWTPENAKIIGEIMAIEALHAIQVDGNAATWYRDKVEGAMRVAALVHPEIATDVRAATAFKFILAVTSNGSTVTENSRSAFDVYESIGMDDYLPGGRKHNQPIQIPPKGFGKEVGAMEKAFDTWNKHTQEMGVDNFIAFLNQDFTVGELRAMGHEVSGELVTEQVKGSVIFGSKIGGGFFQNLVGNFDSLTMDLWFMRSWGRWSGTLIPTIPEKTKIERFDRLRAMLTDSKQRKLSKLGIKMPTIKDAKKMTEEQLNEIAVLILRADSVDRGNGTFEKTTTKTDKNGVVKPARPELHLAAQRVAEGAKKVLDQPSGGGHRRFMREAARESLEVLKSQGIDLELADLQALLWYPEKDLSTIMGNGTKRTAPTDYETEFSELAKKGGFSDANIQGAVSAGVDRGGERAGTAADSNGQQEDAGSAQGKGPYTDANGKFTLDQKSKDSARGSITFGQNMDEIVIRLFKAENLSTFLHESGHLYLEMMSELSQMPTASQGLKDDFQVVRDWLGMEPGEAFTTEQHEKWAETYEKYLQTAEAPSVGLLDAFAKFSSWLNVIYKKFGLKRAKLTPEIHGVMDRMLASEEAISEARGFASMEPMFADAAQAGVTEEQFQKYILDKEKAQQAQTAELVAQNLKDISRETNKWWKEQSAALTKKILIELDADQTWLMAYAIKNGKSPSGAPLPAYLDAEMKIDRKALENDIDAQAFRFMPGGMLSNSGSDPDSVAAVHGFNSGSEMIQAFQAMPKNENGKFLTPAQFAKAEAQKRMTEEHGDMLTDGTMHEEALIRVHSENQSRLIARELKWLIIQEAKKGNAETGKSRTVNSKIAKAAAKRIIANKKVGQILTPNKFLNAEMKAAKQAMAATLKGDFSVAAEAKQRQLLNFHLYREARTAAEKSTKIATKLSKLQRDIINPKVIHPDFVAQVKELLSDVSFGKKAGEKRIQTLKLKALDAFVAESEKEWGASFAISPELDRALSNDNYQDMTFSELDGLNDTVTSIMAQGRKFSKTKQDELKALVSDITNSIEYNTKTKKKESREDKFFSKLARGAIQFVANHRQISSLSLELDGYEANGLMQKHVFNRIKRANDAYLDRGMSAAREMNKILGVYSKKELTLFYMNKTYIPAIDDSLSLSGRLSFALNMGNTGNADVMLEEYSHVQINAVLSTLTDKDWDVVEAMWKHIDSYWNDTLDANGNVIAEGISSVERRVTGVIPQKIDAAPFTTSSGRVISGGYYPLVADPHRGTKSLGRADMDARNSLEGLIGGAHSKSTTKNGSTTERTGGFAASGRVVQLDLSVAFNHVDGIVKDIEMREAVVEVDQLIRKLNKPIKEAKGDQFYQQYESFIKDVVGVREPVDIIEKIVQYSRTGASIAEMGLSIRTMLQQPFGITQTIALIGEKYTTIGTAEFFAGSGRQVRGVASRLVGNSGAEISNKAVEKVMSLSSFMRNRGATFNRDVKDAQKMMGVKGLQDDVVNFSFKGIQMLDMAVSIPSWLGAYQKAQDEGMTLDEAVDYADSIVARGQGSGLERDMSSLQRGNVWKKMFTMFYTFFNAYYNVQADMFKQTKFSSPKSLSRYLLNQVWVTMIPSMLIDYLFNGGPEDDENPVFWGLKSTGSFMFGGMLLVRDVVNAMKTGFGYQMSPAGGVASKTVAAVQQVAQGEADVQLTKALLMALGYLGHVPGTRTATRFVDVVDDQGFDPKDPEFWWRAFVMGKKK